MKSTTIQRGLKGQFTLIAEAGVNYYDIAKQRNITLMEAACMMIDEAATCGAHAIKFQTYKASSLASRQSPSYWDLEKEPTCSQFELFQKYDSFEEQDYALLANHCISRGIEFLSTAFDFESADYLDKYMHAYKVSSSDVTNIPFIRHQAQKGKPMLLSVGASNADEIDEAVKTIRTCNQMPLVLLHCVLEYPTPAEHANLKKIMSLKQTYADIIVGYSDHTVPDQTMDVIKTAYLLGACVIEKHFTLDKTLQGNDHYHAMDPTDVHSILRKIEKLDTICGSGDLKALQTEQSARMHARRSIVNTVEIRQGQVIDAEMVTFKRPGTGISPLECDMLIGKKAKTEIKQDTVLQWTMFE